MSDIIVKNKIPFFELIAFVISTLIYILIGITFYLTEKDYSIYLVCIYYSAFIFIGFFVRNYSLKENIIIITKKELIINYFMIGKTKHLKWSKITEIEQEPIIIGNSDFTARSIIGKKIRLFYNGRNHYIKLFNEDKDSYKIFLQLKKRLNKKLFVEMNNEYSKVVKEFKNTEKENDEFDKKIGRIILILIIIIFIIFKLIF